VRGNLLDTLGDKADVSPLSLAAEVQA